MKATRAENFGDNFPFKMFVVYVLFYAGQAIFNVFINLFLYENGFSQTQIGMVTSVSTLLLLVIQPLWGVLSDKSKNKNQIVAYLMIACCIISLSFYFSKGAIWLSLCYILFNLFFNPAMTLQDSNTLERLDNSRWDFGQLRLGGTLGYAACAMLIGYVVKDQYDHIFWIITLFFAVTSLLYFSLPKVSGHRKKSERVKYSTILKDKALLCMFLFNVVYALGGSFFFQYYSIYFKETLHASEGMVGLLSTFSALAEIPFFWFAARLQRRFGTKKLMIFAGTASALRWLLLATVNDHIPILLINMLSGCGFVGFSYSLLRHINDHVPKKMRATAQSLNGIMGAFISRVIFSPLSGYLADNFDVPVILVGNGILLAVGTILFALIFTRLERRSAAIPFPEES